MPKLFCWAIISYQQFSHFANLLFIRELNSIIRWLNWLWNCSMRKKVGVKCQAINWNITLAMSEVIRKQIKNHTPTRNYQLEKNHSSIIMSKLDWKTPLEIISNWIFFLFVSSAWCKLLHWQSYFFFPQFFSFLSELQNTGVKRDGVTKVFRLQF